jgi:hypothetical protein
MQPSEDLIKMQEKLALSVQEQIWGLKFHDSIRGLKAVNETSYFVGNWAGNYTFFYLLSRILQEYQFNTILEFGLGESSKFISAYIGSTPKCANTKHDIFEQNKDFALHFQQRHQLSSNSSVQVYETVENDVFGNLNKMYNVDFSQVGDYDFYVVDGPIGSPRFSRFDLVKVTEQKKSGDEFLILFDDLNRIGEVDTLNYMMDSFKERGIEADSFIYSGEKSVAVIATPKYKWALSF